MFRIKAECENVKVHFRMNTIQNIDRMQVEEKKRPKFQISFSI